LQEAWADRSADDAGLVTHSQFSGCRDTRRGGRGEEELSWMVRSLRSPCPPLGSSRWWQHDPLSDWWTWGLTPWWRLWATAPPLLPHSQLPARSALHPDHSELELVNRYTLLSTLPSGHGGTAGQSRKKRASCQGRVPGPTLIRSAWQFVEIAAESIRGPGHASSIVPLLIRVPSEIADNDQTLDFYSEDRDKVSSGGTPQSPGLAQQLDIPGRDPDRPGRVNHWLHCIGRRGLRLTAPMAELISHCLTVGYLQPRLRREW